MRIVLAALAAGVAAGAVTVGWMFLGKHSPPTFVPAAAAAAAAVTVSSFGKKKSGQRAQ